MTYAHPYASLFPFIWIFLETKTQHMKRKGDGCGRWGGNQAREKERKAQESNLEFLLHEFCLLLSSAAPSFSISLASVSIPSFESAAACI
jgi:hypothetical protein